MGTAGHGKEDAQDGNGTLLILGLTLTQTFIILVFGMVFIFHLNLSQLLCVYCSWC